MILCPELPRIFRFGLAPGGVGPGIGGGSNLRVMERRGLVIVEDAKPNHPQGRTAYQRVSIANLVN